MADRSSAGVFAVVFGVLAKDPTEERKNLAREIYGHIRQYDFNECQMEADEALIALGLAHMGYDPEWPDEEVVIYGPVAP